MGEATLEVPPQFVPTLRNAVLAEVKLWRRATKREIGLVQEARYLRDDNRLSAREGDLATSQQMLAESSVFVSQVPLYGTEAPAKLDGDRHALDALFDQGARFAATALVEQLHYSPIERTENVRGKMAELDWWVSQIEGRA
jgi:hypothetical protein